MIYPGDNAAYDEQHTTEALKTVTETECLQTRFEQLKYCRTIAEETRPEPSGLSCGPHDCGNNNGKRKPKAVKQIMPWKSVKKKNARAGSSAKEEEAEAEEEGSGGWAFAQEKFNERRRRITLHCPSSRRDTCRASRQTVLPKPPVPLAELPDRVRVLSLLICPLLVTAENERKVRVHSLLFCGRRKAKKQLVSHTSKCVPIAS